MTAPLEEKITNLNDFGKKLESYRTSSKQLVFTNGCFDILHAGHVQYLHAAWQEGDVLVVGLNSDLSVRTIKGDKRPIVPQTQRAIVLAALWFVDHVIIFDEPDPLRLIQTICPQVLVKGSDWSENAIIGTDVVKANGGRVVRIPLTAGLSTSGIIERIVSRFH